MTKKKICGTEIQRDATLHIIRALNEKAASYTRPMGHAWTGWTLSLAKSLASGEYKIVENTETIDVQS
jgi:hypothetical protein